MTDSNVGNSGGSTNRTSSSLLVRAVAKDGAAWKTLVELYTPLVAHWCGRWNLQAADVANVVQEVFAAVAEHLARFDHGRGSFRGWLYTIARSKLANQARAAGEHVNGVGGSDALQRQLQVAWPSADDPSTLGEEKKLLYRRALEIIKGVFSATDWQAFLLVVCEDKAPSEVAAELGISVNKVYLAKSRILQKLREEFRELIEA